MINLSGYQEFVKGMTLPKANNLEYGVTNLASEAGEVAGVYAKATRDTDVIFDLYYGMLNRDEEGIREFKEKMAKELGDCLFMVTHVCNQLGLELADVLAGNVEKLESRKARGKIGGSGDSR